MSCVLIVLHHQIAQKNNVENTVKIEFFRMGLQNPDSPVQIWVVPPASRFPEFPEIGYFFIKKTNGFVKKTLNFETHQMFVRIDEKYEVMHK